MNAAVALLTSKITFLRRGLVEVQAALEAVQEQRDVLNAHFQRDAKLMEAVREIDVNTDQADFLLQEHYGGSEVIDAVGVSLQAIQASVKELYGAMKNMRQDKDPLTTWRWVPPTGVEDAIQGTSERVAKALRSLEELDRDASAALALQVAGDGEQARVKFHAAWTSLAAVDLESREIFREYVDLLAGIALRDTGYDQGIGSLADQLMSDWRYPTWNGGSFAVPAHQESTQATLARLLRIGFPEWSVWALPLVAHEFAYVLMNEGGALQPVAARYVEVSQSRVLLADIFATRVMGPAYAAALLYLRLDPFAAIADDKQLHIRRAFVIRKSLESLETKEGGDAMADMRKQLTDGWDTVMRQVGKGAAGEPKDAGDLDAIVADLSAAMAYSNEFPTIRWDTVMDWSAALKGLVDARAQGDQARAPWVVGADAEMRLALNAGWRARLNAEADELDALTEVTRDLVITVARNKAQAANAQPVRAGQTYGQSGDALRRGAPPSAQTFVPRRSNT